MPSDKISPFYRKIQSYSDLPEMLLNRIAHFDQHYKDLEGGKWVKIDRWAGEAEARAMIERAIAAARKTP